MAALTEGVTGPIAVNDLLQLFGMPPGSRATIVEAAVASLSDGLTVAGQLIPDQHVILRPAGGGIAAYVERTRITLLLERRRALRAAREHEFCRVEDDAPTATRLPVVVEDWAVSQHAIAVRRLLRDAIAGAVAPAPSNRSSAAVRGTGAVRSRAAAGNRAEAPAAPEPRKLPVCPVHFTVLVNGTCDYCD